MVSTELLRRYPLFAGLSFYMLDEIAMISDEVDVEKDQWIFHENDEAEKFYMILDGKVVLTMYLFHHGKAYHFNMTESIGKGEILGWSALVKPYNYTLGARAEADSCLLAIEAQPLRQLMDDNPEYGYILIKNVAEVISERLVYKCIQLLSLILDEEENQTYLV